MTRLNEFRTIGLPEARAVFGKFDPAIAVRAIEPMRGGMSTSNYAVYADAGKFLLKLYAAGSGVEPGMYARLRGVVPTPKLFYWDAACAILEYIDGETLNAHILRAGRYPPGLAREAGALLGRVHAQGYEWNVPRADPDMRARLLALVNGLAGTHLSARTRSRVAEFCAERADAFGRIGASRALCHGDYNYGNILASGGRLLLIDFEYASAGSVYRDIGKFFRRKSDELQRMIGAEVYAAFAEGYGDLPGDWLFLARIADAPAMLALIDREAPPREWVDDIERDILFAMDGRN